MRKVIFLVVMFLSTLYANTNLNFDQFLLPQGLNNIDASMLQSSAEQGVQNAPSGFVCPKLVTINDAAIPKDVQGNILEHEVNIREIDFISGRYVCSYHFLARNNYYEIKRINTLIQNERDEIKKLKPSNLPSMSINNAFGLYMLTQDISVSKDFKTINANLETGLNELANTYQSAGTTLNLKKSIDSHTHHTDTLASIFLGVLTTDTEYLQKNVAASIGTDGSLALESNNAGGVNKDGSISSNSTEHVTDLTQGLDKKFWGYYHYLIANVSYTFGHIIQMIFGLGAIGLFGYAYAQKLTSDQQKNFDFKGKFLGVFTAFALFSAPIIPGSTKIPSDYLYYAQDNTTQEVTQNSTPIQVFLRYTFQLGTFWANQLNDAALYAYLKYISSEYGHFNAQGVTEQYTKDMQNWLLNTKSLQNRMEFFEKTCAYNYSNQLLRENGLPAYNEGTIKTFNHFEKESNALQIDGVEYTLCASLFSEIQRDSNKYLLDYKNINNTYSTMSNTLKQLKTTDIKELDEFLSFTTNINNSYGWISVLMIPSLTHIFEAKNILKYTISHTDKNEDLINGIGEMKANTTKLKVTEEKIKAGLDESAKASELTMWESFLKKIGFFKDKMLDPVMNFTSEKITGPLVGSAAAYSIYYMLPGFHEVYTMLHTSGIVANILQLISNVTSTVITLSGPFGAAFEALLSIKNILMSGADSVSFFEFIANYVIAIFLYTFLLATMALLLITVLIILKIIFFYIDIIISFFISTAVMLWSLVFDQDQAKATISKFFYKTTLLSFTPISIVMSVYVYMFSNAALYYLWHNFVELVYTVSTKATGNLDGSTLSGSFAQVQAFAVYKASDIIFTFVSIILAYVILFKFHDRVLEFFGHDGASGISKYVGKAFDSLQHKLAKV